MESKKIKIVSTKNKFNYLKTYKDWQLKICKWIEVTPKLDFWVELIVEIEHITEVSAGDVIRFENGYQARIMQIDKENNSFICNFGEMYTTNYF